MHTVDLAVVCVAAAVVVVFAAVLARQRYLLHVTGAFPVATLHGSRWRYGVARYAGDELRIFRAFGVGTRPSSVLRRSQIRLDGHRPPQGAELGALPHRFVVVDYRVDGAPRGLALGGGAFTGFVSWLESSAPI